MGSVSERVLLVEDDESLGRQIVGHLEGDGFTVDWIKDGDTALAADPAPYSLVILDLMLPGAYGLDVLKRLREDHDVPVLILSARNETADKVRSLQLGADDYVTKPFWPERRVEVEGETVELTRAEFEILSALARRAGSAVARAWLLDALQDGTERTLDVHVSRLRKKLGPAGGLIKTVWNIGYRLDA